MIGKNIGRSRFEVTHIDMVPMVDCIMVLVIFLMISSAFINDPGVEVQKPDVSGSMSGEQNCAPDRDLGGQPHLLRRAGDPRRPGRGRGQAGRHRAFPSLIIRGDRSSNLGVFAAVYSEAKRSGIQHVEFATARAGGP
jgi:biopolymer transport protein ExbD